MAMERTEITPIAVFHSPFTSKFGIPRQSGIVDVDGEIVMEPEFRDKDALRGLDGFDYVWLVWGFSANRHAPASLVVRPPRLGGNAKTGVFASRSPYRPNGLGLSSVRLASIEWDTPRGPVVHVKGADLMDGTPIFDIKPYVAYADSHPDARSGFVDRHRWQRLEVDMPVAVAAALRRHGLGEGQLAALRAALAEDPRPPYQKAPQKVYGMPFAGLDIHFRVDGNRCVVLDATACPASAAPRNR